MLRTSRRVPESPSSPEEDQSSAYQVMASPMAIALPAGFLRQPPSSSSPPRSPEPNLKILYLFDALLRPTTPSRPRIVHVRGLNHISDSSLAWLPHLLTAVRESLPKTVIVYSVTPNLSLHISSDGSTQYPLDDESMGKSVRERNFRAWIRNWEAHADDAIRAELPDLELGSSADSPPNPGIRIIGPGGGVPGLPEGLSKMIRSLTGAPGPSPGEKEEERSPYTACAAVIPAIRNATEERMKRASRRNDLNDLSMTLALRAMGGEPVESRDMKEEMDEDQLEEASNMMLKVRRDWGMSLMGKEEMDEVAVRG